MAQNSSVDHDQESSEAILDRLMRDSEVVMHRGRSKKPFVSELRVTEGLDVLVLLGRYGEDDDKDVSDNG
jgi:hypothetical protein